MIARVIIENVIGCFFLNTVYNDWMNEWEIACQKICYQSLNKPVTTLPNQLNVMCQILDCAEEYDLFIEGSNL